VEFSQLTRNFVSSDLVALLMVLGIIPRAAWNRTRPSWPAPALFQAHAFRSATAASPRESRTRRQRWCLFPSWNGVQPVNLSPVIPDETDNRLFIYRVDAQDRIVFANDEWYAFARENGARPLKPDSVIQRLLWDFIGNAETQHLFQILLKKIRRPGVAVTL